MPTFEYVCLKPGSNEQLKGKIDADTERDARSRLRSRGEIPVKLNQLKIRSGSNSQFRIQVKTFDKEVLIFTNQLATLIRSGIQLQPALHELAEDNTNKEFSNVLNLIAREIIEKGTSFSQALALFPNIFPPIYVSMVRASEFTGALPEALDRLAAYTKKKKELEQRITKALTYPIIMLIFMTGVLIFLLSYLVPKILPLLKSKGDGQLPWATELLDQCSTFLVTYWLECALGALAFLIGLIIIKSTEKGKFFFDQLSLKAPLFGTLVRKTNVSRFCITLSSLLRSGVAIEEALKVVEQVVSNELIRRTIRVMQQKIREGSSISGPLAESKIFPRVVIYMITVGEKSGSNELNDMLDSISEAFDLEVQQSAERLTGMINPLLVIIMAAMICFVMVAILIPIMGLGA